jgi:hypothetical protein
MLIVVSILQIKLVFLRYDFKNIHKHPNFDRYMAQTVSRRPVTEEAWVRTWANPCSVCGGKIALRHAFLQVLRFFLSISFLRGSSSLYVIWGDEQ